MSDEASKRTMLRIASRSTRQAPVAPTLRSADVLAMVRVKAHDLELTFPLPTKDRGVLRTVGDVHAYLEALPKTRRRHIDRQHAEALLLRRNPHHLAALTRRVQTALFLDGQLDDGQFRPNVNRTRWRRRYKPSLWTAKTRYALFQPGPSLPRFPARAELTTLCAAL
jgi:hypothetical protein